MIKQKPKLFWQEIARAMESQQLAAFVCDLQGTVDWASAAFVNLAGLPDDTSPGWSMLRMLAPESLSSALHNIRRSASGERHIFQMRCVDMENIRFDLSLLTFPMLTPDGNAGFGRIAFQATGETGTAEKSDPLFQHALQKMPFAAAITDNHGQLLWANTAYCEATGTGPANIGELAVHLQGHETFREDAEDGQTEWVLDDGTKRRSRVTRIGAENENAAVWLHTITAPDTARTK